jgi:hypothetical protein
MIVAITGDPLTTNFFLILRRVEYWHTQVEPISLLVCDSNGNSKPFGAAERGGRAAIDLGIDCVMCDGLPVGQVDLLMVFHERVKSDVRVLGLIREANERGILVELATRDEIVFPYEYEGK